MDSTGRKMGSGGAEYTSNPNPIVAEVASTIPQGGLNLLGDDDTPPVQKAQTPAAGSRSPANPFESSGETIDTNKTFGNIKIPMSQVLQETVPGIKQKRAGVRILASVQKEGIEVALYLEVENKTPTSLSNFAVMLDANSYKLAAANQQVDMAEIGPGNKGRARILLAFSGKSNGQPPGSPFRVQVALNTNIDIFTFSVPISFSVMLQPARACSQAEFQALQSRPNQVATKENFPCQLSEQEYRQKLEANHVAYVGQLTNPQAAVSRIVSPSHPQLRRQDRRWNGPPPASRFARQDLPRQLPGSSPFRQPTVLGESQIYS